MSKPQAAGTAARLGFLWHGLEPVSTNPTRGLAGPCGTSRVGFIRAFFMVLLPGLPRVASPASPRQRGRRAQPSVDDGLRKDAPKRTRKLDFPKYSCAGALGRWPFRELVITGGPSPQFPEEPSRATTGRGGRRMSPPAACRPGRPRFACRSVAGNAGSAFGNRGNLGGRKARPSARTQGLVPATASPRSSAGVTCLASSSVLGRACRVAGARVGRLSRARHAAPRWRPGSTAPASWPASGWRRACRPVPPASLASPSAFFPLPRPRAPVKCPYANPCRFYRTHTRKGNRILSHLRIIYGY